MKKIIVASIMIACSYSTFCQDLPDLQKYRTDIGFNTSIIFSGLINSNGSPFDLMLKRQTTSNSAIRFGTSIYGYTLNNLNIYNQQSYDQTASYYFNISIGKEFQKQITKSWVFYYGADLSPFFDYDQRKSYNQNSSSLPLSNFILQYQTSVNSYGIKLIPFLGIRFNINERLYIATQTNLFLSFSKKEVTQKTWISNNSNYDSNKKSMSEGSVTLSPASGIFFFYRF